MALSLLLLLLSGCGGGGPQSSAGDAGATSAAGPTTRGSLNIVLALLNSRAVKSDVRRFQITLRQNGQVVVSRDFTRSDLGASQQLELSDVPAGSYDLDLLYLSDSGTVLGTYRQTITVAAGAVTTISNPAFQNTLPDFDALSFLPGGLFASAFDIADFNEDGQLDIAFTSSVATSASRFGRLFVALGHGDGSFDLPFAVEVRPGPYWVVTADFNRDGHPDLASANRDDVSVVLGNGDGTFQSSATLSLEGGAAPVALKVADFNRDNIPDLVSANMNSHNASVLLGRGDGNFQTAVNYPLGGGPLDILAIDANHDGLLDLVSANANDDTLSILPGLGNGTFGPGSSLSVGDSPWFLASADFNGDGRPDLAVVNGLDNNVSVLLSRPTAGFGPPQNYPVGETPYSVSLGDSNRDGHPDLLVGNGTGNDFSILLGGADGSFDPEYRVASLLTPSYAEFADVNGDSRLDIVSAQLGGSAVFLAFGNGDGTFQTTTATQMVGVQPRDLLAADLDDDDNLDLITANLTSGDVTISRGRGDGTFLAAQSLDVPGSPVNLAIHDLNEDSQPDLVVTGASVAVLMLANGDGSFQPPASLLSGVAGQVGVGDFNSDHHLDLAIATSNDRFVLLPGFGDGTFATASEIDTGFDVSGLVVADFNHDSRPDVVTVSNQEKVTLNLGQGDGTFGPPQATDVPDPSGSSVTAFVAVDDFNRDGNPDLAVIQHLAGTVTILLGRADGTFANPEILTVGAGVMEVLTDDVNGDGVADLTCTYLGTTSAVPGVSILVGQGNGSFDPPRFFSAQGPTGAAARGDFNHDGATDLAVTNILASDVTILLAR